MAHDFHKETRQIVKNGANSYYINIPRDFIRHLDWQERQKLEVELTDGELRIRDWSK